MSFFNHGHATCSDHISQKILKCVSDSENYAERSCYTVWKTQSKAAYILIHPDSRGLNFIWYTTEDCYNNEDPHKVVEHNITVQSKDMCLKRPGNLHSMEPRKLVK